MFFLLKKFCTNYSLRALFFDVAVVKGGGWVFRGVGPGRGEAKN